MFIFRLVLASLFVVCRAVPDGYILDVSQDCGYDLEAGRPDNVDADQASVTIKSDLHVKAVLKCANDVEVVMDPINDTNTVVTENLYYTGNTNGTEDEDCFFRRPHDESNVYVVDLDVYWGFTDGSLMNEYEAYTITCTVGGNAAESLSGKKINEDAISIKENLEGNLGSAFSGTSTLKLVDVLDQEISAGSIPMAKKVKLQLTVTGGSAAGVTPYDCVAQNSDSTKNYTILNAGCGDGVIFPKDEGFDTSGTEATSPYFKVFKLLEAMGKETQIAYTCEFAICASQCDGTSCVSRRRRSEDVNDQLQASASTSVYQLQNLNRRLHRSEQDLKDIKLRSRMTTSTIAIFGIGGIAVLSLLVALYTCVTKGNRSIERTVA